MAIGKTRRVVIPQKDLPPVTSDNKYLVRYRIISDDKNRVSHWSPVYPVAAKAVALVNTNITKTTSYDGTNSTISVTWDDTQGRASYDIFTRNYFAITHKQITSNVATITTEKTSGIVVGNTITLAGVDSTFNGTYIVTANNPTAKTISFAKTASDVNNTGANGTVNAEYVFHGSTPVHTYSFVANPNSAKVDIAIQVESMTNQKSEFLEIFETTTPVTL